MSKSKCHSRFLAVICRFLACICRFLAVICGSLSVWVGSWRLYVGSWLSSAVPGGYLVLGVLLSCSGQLKRTLQKITSPRFTPKVPPQSPPSRPLLRLPKCHVKAHFTICSPPVPHCNTISPSSYVSTSNPHILRSDYQILENAPWICSQCKGTLST